jgi:hypothetical protein
LLIVGGDDTEVLSLNREAQRSLRCENRLTVVPRATHLFEEPARCNRSPRSLRSGSSSTVAPPGAAVMSVLPDRTARDLSDRNLTGPREGTSGS